MAAPADGDASHASDPQEDFAEVAAFLEEPASGGGPVEGEDLCDPGADIAALEQGDDFRHGPPQHGNLVPEMADVQAEDPLVAVHQAEEPGPARIHVFYSGPMSVAFCLGRQISPTIHSPVFVYNFSAKATPKYAWALHVNGQGPAESLIVSTLAAAA